MIQFDHIFSTRWLNQPDKDLETWNIETIYLYKNTYKDAMPPQKVFLIISLAKIQVG